MQSRSGNGRFNFSVLTSPILSSWLRHLAVSLRPFARMIFIPEDRREPFQGI
jgi:hypothetical protein